MGVVARKRHYIVMYKALDSHVKYSENNQEGALAVFPAPISDPNDQL